jgi:hypothetical protein
MEDELRAALGRREHDAGADYADADLAGAGNREQEGPPRSDPRSHRVGGQAHFIRVKKKGTGAISG